MWERTTCELCPAHQSWSENCINHPGMAQTHLWHWWFKYWTTEGGNTPSHIGFSCFPISLPEFAAVAENTCVWQQTPLPPGSSLSPVSGILVGLVPIHLILDVFQIPLAPNMLFLLEGLTLLMCLIAELTSSLSTQIPWTFGTFPISSQGLDSIGSDHIAWHIF